MFEKAEFEIEIISPCIKRQTWEGIKVSIARLIGKGGSQRVFIRDEEPDLSSGLGDDIREEVEVMGGRDNLYQTAPCQALPCGQERSDSDLG